jgi:hypothetical protein
MGIGKFVVLRSGKGLLVESKPGKASLVINTGKGVTWWEYLLEHNLDISAAVCEFSGLDAMALFHVAVNNFDDAAIMQIVQTAWEEAPDIQRVNDSLGFDHMCRLLDGSLD